MNMGSELGCLYLFIQVCGSGLVGGWRSWAKSVWLWGEAQGPIRETNHECNWALYFEPIGYLINVNVIVSREELDYFVNFLIVLNNQYKPKPKMNVDGDHKQRGNTVRIKY